MEPVAPDWRTIGAAATPPTREAALGRASPSARHVTLAVGASVLALLLGATAAFLVMPATGGVVIDAADAGASGVVTESVAGGAVLLEDPGLGVAGASAPLVVDVEGAVARPGLVHVPAGGRVGDALALAGGFASDADLAAAGAVLNLAQPVTDGLKIVVPAIGEAWPANGQGPSSAAEAPAGGPVDLNHATEAALDALPGVGPATIARIVAAREEAPFTSIDELRSRGILGEATFAKLRDLVTVGR